MTVLNESWKYWSAAQYPIATTTAAGTTLTREGAMRCLSRTRARASGTMLHENSGISGTMETYSGLEANFMIRGAVTVRQMAARQLKTAVPNKVRPIRFNSFFSARAALWTSLGNMTAASGPVKSTMARASGPPNI